MDPTKRAGIDRELLGIAEPIAESPISNGPTTGITSSNQIQAPQLGHSVSTSKNSEVGTKDASQSDLLFSWRISVTDEDFTETRHEEVAGNLPLINEGNRNLGSFGGCSSDAGASNCSFLSIVPVQDMGHSDYIEWESSEMANDCIGTQALHSHHPALRPQDNTNDDADVQTMSDAMFAASITSASEDKGFLPLDALRRIVTPTAVQRLLGHAFPHFKPKVINSWVSSISGKPDEVKAQPQRRKIFAILILMEQVKLIEDFIKHDIDDSFLPLEIKRNLRHKPVIQLQKKDGLVRALRRIHNLRTMSKEDNYAPVPNDPNVLLDNKHWGRHGDIKPENILWFKKYEESRRNFLVISDFGLTRFNTADSRSKVAYDAVKGFSGSYRPPDVDLKRTISQRYDIWSLGCVFLEFVSWFLVGHDRTQKDFTDSRLQEDGSHTGSRILLEDKFFNFNPSKDDGPSTADVKTSVTDVSSPNEAVALLVMYAYRGLTKSC
ncbi:protein kinase domain-containing protein [Colletotrichum abscissum]|uniref:protein kinase domain-containing protein n=1 Tax=Colletotrichum abscissum TaxID=1671311 RepID=UPI0027D55319|nr:protein kinase domain-containing protein [Colletotrichum abscissum]KAK1518549.1 protein kinase domain-containing protein [Colletotrichum abscissum]